VNGDIYRPTYNALADGLVYFFRPLSKEDRERLADLLAALASDIRKGADGGGHIFALHLTRP
jgi:hypothetical protein